MVECLDISILKLQCCKFRNGPRRQQFAGSPLLRLQVIDKHMATITALIVVKPFVVITVQATAILITIASTGCIQRDITGGHSLHISQIVHTDSENRIIACMKPRLRIPATEVTTLCCSIMCISSNRHFAIAPNMRRLCSIARLLGIIPSVVILIVEQFANQSFRQMQLDG